MESDYKNHRIEDPTKISHSQERHVKKHVKEFFDKAVLRKKERDENEAEKRKKEGLPAGSHPTDKNDDESDAEPRMVLSGDEGERPEADMATPGNLATPITIADQLVNGDRFKRKRSSEERNGGGDDDLESTPSKRLRSETPPPPPPPTEEYNLRAGISPGALQYRSNGSSPRVVMESESTACDAVIEPPPAPSAPMEMEGERKYETNDGVTTPMMFSGMNGTSSEGDDVEIDQANLSVHGLGMDHVRELQVGQGH